MLRGALGDADTLYADTEPRRVHHHEHRRETAVFFPDEIADGAALLAELHHAGRARHDAELMLDPGADDVVAFAQRAIVVDEEFRDEKKRDAARPGRRIRQAGEHEVDDVLRHVVFAVGDEDFRAGDAVAAVALRFGPRRQTDRDRSRPAARSSSSCRSRRRQSSSAGIWPSVRRCRRPRLREWRLASATGKARTTRSPNSKSRRQRLRRSRAGPARRTLHARQGTPAAVGELPVSVAEARGVVTVRR